jgi:ubiquinol-cytochrome c reductase cytochrome b subunit
MRIIKKNNLINLLYQSAVTYPVSPNITYLWNFGSLAGLCLVIQIITGIFLAMHYTPHIDLHFIV